MRTTLTLSKLTDVICSRGYKADWRSLCPCPPSRAALLPPSQATARTKCEAETVGTVERCLACEAETVGTMERCLACEAETVGTLERCLACEAETVGTMVRCLASTFASYGATNCVADIVATRGALSCSRGRHGRNQWSDVEKIMKKLLVPNLQSEGRWARGAVAFMFGAVALALIPFSRRLSILVFFAAIFTAFEAIRGWCVLRACGIRTQV